MLALIEARLDTTMWNEGFEKAEEPWAGAYTRDPAVAAHFARLPLISVPGDDGWPQDYNIRVLPMTDVFQPPVVKTSDHLSAQERWDDVDGAIEASARYLGLLEGPKEEQVRVFTRRLLDWDGI